MVLGGRKEKEARKVFRKDKTTSLEVVFAYANQKRVQTAIKTRTKGRGKDHKGKCKEGAYPQSGLAASETPGEEVYGHACKSDDWHSSLTDESSCSVLRGTTAWYCTGHTAWMASVPRNLANHPTHVVLDLDCTRSSGSRAAIKRFQKHVLYLALRQSFWLLQ